MFRLIGRPGRDLCDHGMLPSRRDVLRVGASGMLGISLPSLLRLQHVQGSEG